MGGYFFADYAKGTDPDALFWKLKEQAQWDHGHAGYTGTIAEKPGYELVQETPILHMRDLENWARGYEHYNPNDKWGPAFAVPVYDNDETKEVVGYLFFGWASS